MRRQVPTDNYRYFRRKKKDEEDEGRFLCVRKEEVK